MMDLVDFFGNYFIQYSLYHKYNIVMPFYSLVILQIIYFLFTVKNRITKKIFDFIPQLH